MMRTILLLIVLLCSALLGCRHAATEAPAEIGVPASFDGFISAEVNGSTHQLYIFANFNGYKDGEIVLRGSGEGLDRVLMLTFQLKSKGVVAFNKEMTGFWDLGLCIPFRRYLLAEASFNYVSIDSYDAKTGKVTGRFSIKVRNEETPNDVIEFKNGRFVTRLNAAKFEYCTEG
ncbi:MAG: hypothetical protein ACREOI_18835 [bacterium]